VAVSYENRTKFDDLDKERHLHVFRVLQELMSNSLRHGKAKNISIVFEEDNGLKKCHYTDDGCGFDSKDKQKQQGLGMKNIESRIAFISGKITFDSVINKGVEIVFIF
jgi:signal transduction histidine kinase